MIRALAGLVLGIAVLALAACGEQTLDPETSGDSIANLVSEQTGFEPTDVECPDDVTAEAGETFQCTFTGPDGDYVANAEIVSVEGDTANFNVQTELAE